MSTQPLGRAEESLNVEAAWASARLGGTVRAMTSRDCFEVSRSGRSGGFADGDAGRFFFTTFFTPPSRAQVSGLRRL